MSDLTGSSHEPLRISMRAFDQRRSAVSLFSMHLPAAPAGDGRDLVSTVGRLVFRAKRTECAQLNLVRISDQISRIRCLEIEHRRSRWGMHVSVLGIPDDDSARHGASIVFGCTTADYGQTSHAVRDSHCVRGEHVYCAGTGNGFGFTRHSRSCSEGPDRSVRLPLAPVPSESSERHH